MQTHILKANEADEYYFDEGCFILELSNSAADPDVSIARARVKPGVKGLSSDTWFCQGGQYILIIL